MDQPSLHSIAGNQQTTIQTYPASSPNQMWGMTSPLQSPGPMNIPVSSPLNNPSQSPQPLMSPSQAGQYGQQQNIYYCSQSPRVASVVSLESFLRLKNAL